MDDKIVEELLRRITRLERGLVDLIRPEVPRWVDWTPTVTQGVAVTFTNTYARYCLQGGNIAHVLASMAITSAGTAGTLIEIGGIPSLITAANLGGSLDLGGTFLLFDTGTTQYTGAAFFATGTTIRFRTNGVLGNLGATPNFALANGDEINLNLTYEVA